VSDEVSDEMSDEMSNQNFNLKNLSMREFEALLIILKSDGKELSVLKTAIDLKFENNSKRVRKANEFPSRTKGYDYINSLKKKGLIKKVITKPATGGKRTVRIYVKKKIRSEFERLILPTVKNLNDSIKKLSKDYMTEIKEEEKLKEKFRFYTETILQAINLLLEETPAKSMNKTKLQKKITDTIWRYFRAEMLKTEMFSK
jgi:hypothetical protein